ncbi:MAG TPA: hypothetical protein DHW64_06110 [Chitinophagaceae bacterium]|nr:hypothetical protein [Chitinophagaceae bacterium]
MIKINDMNKSIVIIAFLLPGNLVSAQQTKAVQWMVGIWKINTPQGTVVEIWETKNDSTLQGRSVFVKSNNDTIPQERIEMAFRNGEWYYIPTVSNQNDGKPVSFKVIFLRANEFVSENPAHDFPQRIAYRRIKQNMYASIEGKRNGRFSKQNFDFTTE